MRGGRVKQVYVQGEADSRMLPADLSRWYVRNSAGGMVPFDTFLTGTWTLGPQKVEGYNGLTSFEILGAPAPGHSTGEAMTAIQRLLARLPQGVGYEWTGLSFEQEKSGSQTGPLYAISLLVILFCLAALYESWSIPVAVLLVVPLGIIGAISATLIRGLDNDVYFQVGLLTTVGLAVKNAILIVEFAKAFFSEGMRLHEAALKAAQERLRPILMTSIAFVLGTAPLAIATGAGAASRVAIGTAVVGGMVSATFLAIFFVPVFFVAVLRFFRVRPRAVPQAPAPAMAETDMRLPIPAAALAATLAGCSLVPDYQRPALPVSMAWPNEVGQTSKSASEMPAAELGWRDFFHDPVMQELIALSLADNRDLRVAILNVAQAQAQYRVDRSSLFPTLNGTAGLDWSSTPGDTVGSSGAYKVRDYSLGLGAVNWELDLFGRIRSQAQQAKETFLSDAETQLGTQISLVAQVGSAYLTWLADRDALKVSQDTVKIQSDSLRLTQLKVTQGSATALDAAQAEIHAADRAGKRGAISAASCAGHG